MGETARFVYLAGGAFPATLGWVARPVGRHAEIDDRRRFRAQFSPFRARIDTPRYESGAIRVALATSCGAYHAPAGADGLVDRGAFFRRRDAEAQRRSPFRLFRFSLRLSVSASK